MVKIFGDFCQSERLKIGIFGLGYETRSPDVFSVYGDRCESKIAVGYTYFQDAFDYARNKQLFTHGNAFIIEPKDEDLKSELSAWMNGLGLAGPVRVLVDISVLSRHRVARIIWTLLEALPEGSNIDIAYNVAEFVPPPAQKYPVSIFGPIINELNTFPGRPTLPVSLLCGIGYERDKALGAIANIDPTTVYLLSPVSLDRRYDEASVESNSILERSFDEAIWLSYDLTKPISTYLDLKSLITGLKGTNRIVAIPLGPKILTAIFVILAWEYFPEVAVWRVSSGEAESPLNKMSSGTLLGFSIEVEKR